MDSGEDPKCHPDCKPPKPPRDKTKPSKLDKVLTALHGLGGDKEAKAHADIAVAAWRKDKSFGLEGYQDHYPDAQRVVTALVHLQDQGLVSRDKPRHYRLTERGIWTARKLIEEKE